MRAHPEFCIHYEHGYFFDREDIYCANCGEPLTILQTLDPNEKWTITNDGKGNLTIEHF